MISHLIFFASNNDNESWLQNFIHSLNGSAEICLLTQSENESLTNYLQSLLDREFNNALEKKPPRSKVLAVKGIIMFYFLSAAAGSRLFPAAKGVYRKHSAVMLHI